MSNVPFVSVLRAHRDDAGPAIAQQESACARGRVNTVTRVSLAALLALAAAGCSQEVQRYDHSGRDSGTAALHFNETRLAQDGFASWRRDDGADLRTRQSHQRRDHVTRSLPRGDTAPGYSARHRDPTPPRRRSHTVRRGETLFRIAQRYDVSVEELARFNRLQDPSFIRVGDEIFIPDQRYQRPVRRADSQPTVGPQARTSRPQPRPSPEGRYTEARAPRYAGDQLYADPLLRERYSPYERQGFDRAPRRTAEPDRPEPQHAERRQSPAAPPRTFAPVTPPPAPARRPVDPQRSQLANAETGQPPRAERPEATAQPNPSRIASAPRQQDLRVEQSEPAKPSEPRLTEAECRALMKNPPARSGANFRRPATGLTISHFGAQTDGQRNDGINISVPRGTPVKAAENGIVVYAGEELTGLGKLVLVRHADGWVSAYAHNDQLLVKRCDTVERGDMIARAGVSGSVTKPQIHFELRKNARPVDPTKYLAGTS